MGSEFNVEVIKEYMENILKSWRITYMLQNKMLQGTVVPVSDVACGPLVIKHGIMRRENE